MYMVVAGGYISVERFSLFCHNVNIPRKKIAYRLHRNKMYTHKLCSTSFMRPFNVKMKYYGYCI